MHASGCLLGLHGISISVEDSGNHALMRDKVVEGLNLFFLALKFRTKIVRCVSVQFELI